MFLLVHDVIWNVIFCVYRDLSIPEEKPDAEKPAPKKGQQYIVVKTSPKSSHRGRSGTNSSANQQTRGLLSHSSDSEDATDDANEKLMKPEQKKTKKHFSVGSDDDDDDDGGLQMKRSWELFIWMSCCSGGGTKDGIPIKFHISIFFNYIFPPASQYIFNWRCLKLKRVNDSFKQELPRYIFKNGICILGNVLRFET